ncbi:MAG: mannose-6-phosphate isomerase [Desulfarculus sp.]|nr:MAG: mannose-6-phosphate isomerase [Desulfarculus sp.]
MSGLPGPLRLQPVFLTKPWAADQLPGPLGQALQPPPRTGEVWLASDRLQVTPIADGEQVGLGLDLALARWPDYILGPGRTGPCPLLVKLLNVGQWLSVQVHPDDQAARRLEQEPWGKSEAWHILAAGPGAQMIHGLALGVDRAGLERALAQGRLPEALAKVPVQAGETYLVPAGTVHAPGPGLLMFEVQQASDVTYRFYDWDRLGDDGRPRPLHQAKALAVMQATGPGRPTPPRPLSGPPLERVLLAQDPHFRLLRCRLTGQADLPAQEGLSLLFVLQGQGRLSFPGGQHPAQELAPGQSWLLPAGLAPARLQASAEGIIYLESLASGG